MTDTITRLTFPVKKDVWLQLLGADNLGNGKGKQLIVGAIGTAKNRVELSIPYDLSGKGVSIADAGLRFRVFDSDCVDRGPSPHFLAQQCTSVSSLKEGHEDGDCHVSSNGDGLVWPGDASSATNEGVYNPGSDPGSGWADVSLKAMVAALFAEDSTKTGTLFLKLLTADETDITQRIVFHSAQAGDTKAPYLWVDIDSNHPPNAPIIVTPEQADPAVVGSADADSLTVTFLFSDNDPADNLKLAQLDVFADSARDGALGTVLLSSGPIAPTPLGPPDKYSIAVRGFVAAGFDRTTLRFAVKTQDNHGKWGARSSMDVGRFKTAYVPGAPRNSTFTGIGPPTSGGSDPDGPGEIGGTLNSADDADYITAWHGIFYRDTPTGRVTLWDSGDVAIGGASTRSVVEYQGTELRPGWMVKWKHKHANRDGVWGPYTAEISTPVKAQTGPSITPADSTTKLLSRTALITVTFDQSCSGYRYRLYRDGAQIYDSGLVVISPATSASFNLPTGIVNWCDDLMIEAAERPVSGTLSDYSPQSALHVDCLPATRLSVVDES